ncbi:hypothetical protein [Vogesella indigofera]|uniref:hypothetical protein n=1 Tax=Vogesella indigofera TaxID=45465 RepID=UPI00234EDC4B|nr:hypothetical protein [Vogesella indigofera]MDC7699568.1 hypothetical protein [Vogesella indigofera]
MESKTNSSKVNFAAKTKVLNRYIKKRFGFAHSVNGYIAKYLLTCRNDHQLAGVLTYLKEAIGSRVQPDCRGVLQWQAGESA